MACPCCATSQSGGMASPCFAKMMQPMMRYAMNGLMKITDHDNDITYKEVQDFMVPASTGKPFTDKPGTFDESMTARMTEVAFPVCGCKSESRPRLGP